MKKNCLIVVLLTLVMQMRGQKFEGLALTPPMGWNSWNTFQTNISEQLVKQTADIIVSSGMKDAATHNLCSMMVGWQCRETALPVI
jgi:alpha-galactosidase